MVAAVRGGESQRAVARGFGVSLHTVQRWVDRVAGQRLDRVDWSDRASGPVQASNRTSADMEALILQTRLVRCEVLLHKGKIRFFQLRRRAPKEQPLLSEVVYHLPKRPFHE